MFKMKISDFLDIKYYPVQFRKYLLFIFHKFKFITRFMQHIFCLIKNSDNRALIMLQILIKYLQKNNNDLFVIIIIIFIFSHDNLTNNLLFFCSTIFKLLLIGQNRIPL